MTGLLSIPGLDRPRLRKGLGIVRGLAHMLGGQVDESVTFEVTAVPRGTKRTLPTTYDSS